MSTSSKTSGGHPDTDKYIVLQGYLKKLKTMRKKYFVLFCDSVEKSARLEYYDNEKKFKTRFGQPKRSIVLKSCFHINRRLDTKHKYVVSLYTKDDCFCVVLESEADMTRWLSKLQSLHRTEEAEGDKPRTSFGKCFFVFFLFDMRFLFFFAARALLHRHLLSICVKYI